MPLLPLIAEGPGLVDFDWASALWILCIFLALLILLGKYAWPNVMAGLTAREMRIRGAIADADAARVKGEETLKEYNKQLTTAATQVRELLSQATVDAEKIASSIKMRAQQEVEEIKEKATAEIESNKKQAIIEVYQHAGNLSTSIAEKILKRNLNADDQRDLVNQSLEQLKSVNA
jgi:F-type H+-transporting ATPase subunit b